jgi:anti-sigma regulatory factor (Ser/Thr protein kinase)
MEDDTMRHDVLIYDADEDYQRQLAPFFEAGLDAGEALVAVPGRTTEPLLRDALGAMSERVEFHRCEDWYTRPEAALAGYDTVVRTSLRNGATGVRVAAELPFCSSDAQWDDWVRYEAIINRAFAERPVSIICTCDSRVLPRHVVDAMRHTHSHVVSDGRRESPDYQDPEEVVRRLAAAPERLPRLHDVAADGGSQELKDALSRALADAGVAGDAAEAMVLAASEVVVNAERHGGGVRTLRVGGGGGNFVCEVSDAGRGLEDPLAGYLPPGAGAGHGGGLWVARQLTRRLDFVASPEGGLTVRLWV